MDRHKFDASKHEEPKNKPLTRAEVKALKPQKSVPTKDKKGNEIPAKPMLCFQHTAENRLDRRLDKQPLSKSRNRKNTKGRYRQVVPIMIVTATTKWGKIYEPTGYVRLINHHPVEAKIRNSINMK